MRKTKIVCTIGPASESEETLRKMMKAGMNVTRINFSHGSMVDQIEKVNTIKRVREELNLPVALLLDTQGPEIRTGKLEGIEQPVYLEAGNKFVLVNEDIIGNVERTSVSYKNLYKDVKVGTSILVDDGAIELKVEEIVGKDIHCKVVNGGKLGNRKSINVPGTHVSIPNLSEKDYRDLADCAKEGFDYVAASFIRSAKDVLDIRKVLDDNGGNNIKIISKIESTEGVENFDEILAASDGIMVARGDLSVEIPMEDVPILQKQMIKKCNRAGKPVITATQMLESMQHNPRPTRAEVSDVANAIFDMTGAIMLSGESAMGEYPVECVKTMERIANKIEDNIKYWKRFKKRDYDYKNLNYEFNLNIANCTTAMDMGADAIVAYTQAGDTPRIISGLCPACPIYAVTTNKQTFRQLGLSWGVYPILVEEKETADEIIEEGIELLQKEGKLKSGDTVVVAGGAHILDGESTKKAKMNRVIGGVLKI